jgi:hypothetical protein
LRIAKALRLTRDEADLDAGVLTVSETKFHKSRLVPLHPTTTTALRCYAEQRDRFCPLPKASTFFLSDAGIPVKYRRVNDPGGHLKSGHHVDGQNRPPLGWCSRRSRFTAGPPRDASRRGQADALVAQVHVNPSNGVQTVEHPNQ